MKIAITGGIAVGKTYVCDILKSDYGLTSINTDKIIQNDIMYLEEVCASVKKRFGEDSYLNGSVNVDKFNKILYNNYDNISDMNGIVIPHLIKYLNRVDSDFLFIESAAINTELFDIFDFVIIVYRNINDRIKSLMDRYNDYELSMNKINSQSFNFKKVNYVLYNGLYLKSQIYDLLHFKLNI